ncbi:hypothetical protein FRC00_006806 [Tulasnella sp. 408]|nr:hypothetical protein FRC00_006806 [Tulasnella sp. 408]
MESADNSSKEVSWHLIPEEVQNITSLAEAVSEVWEIRTAFSIVTDILRASPCLKALKLVGAFRHQYRFHANDMLIQGEISTFPSLESLEMEGSSSYLFWQVLDTFEFPSLSKLVIYPNHLDPYSGRTIDSVCRDIGGRSSLQSIIDRANCERLTIRIRRGPSPVITIQGMNDAGKVIDLDPLTGDSSTNTILKVLKAIKSPVHIEISGETDGSFIQSIKNTSTIASLRYLPNSQEGGDL